MKKEALRLVTLMVVLIFTTFVFTSGAFAHSNGAPQAKTGSPGDGSNCTSCHGGSAVTVTGWITTNIPTQGYTGGTSYTLTVTATGTGKKGFELSPQNVAGAQLGVLAAGTGSKLVGGTKYVTHTSAGPSSGTSTWSFTWTAPAAGTGTVNLYAAIVVGEPNTKLCMLPVSEYALTPLGVVASATPSTINSGQTSQLDATASGGSGTYTYAWSSVPAGFTSTLQNPVVSPTATTTYTVTVGDGAGSVQGNCTVTVNIPAPLAVVASANPSNINPGQTSQLNASASGGSGSYSYSWTSIPAGFTSSQQNPLVSPTVTTQYTVTTNDSSGSVQANTTVTVTALPLSATASATPSLICIGQTAQLNVVPAGGSGTYTYAWTSVPAGFTSNVKNPVVSPIVATQYNVHVTDGALSVDASTNVAVNQPATANAGNDTTCAYATTQVPLNGSASNYSSVLWTTSGTGTFSAASSPSGLYYPSVADKNSGNITLTLTASAQSPCANPASAVRHIHFDGPTGIGVANGGQPQMVISPNPTTGIFSLRINGFEGTGTSITITDLQGKKILHQNLDESSTQIEQIDLTGYPKGMYLVKIQNETKSVIQKLVIK